MILVSGFFVIDPTKLDRATELVTALVSTTREEPGNIDYSFASVLGDPGRLVITERWEDQASLDAHMVAPHFLEFMGATGELGITQAEVTKFEIASESKLV